LQTLYQYWVRLTWPNVSNNSTHDFWVLVVVYYKAVLLLVSKTTN